MAPRHSLLALVLLASFGASRAHADVALEFSERRPNAAQATTAKAWVASDRVRVEAERQVLVFRADKQVLWAIDPVKKTYLELTKEQLAQVAGAMKQVQEQLAALPPDQRAMMEQMMKGQMGAAGAAAPAREPIAWTPNGTSDTVAGRACKGYDGTRGGHVEEQVCVTDWSAFGVTPQDFAAFEKLAEFLRELTGPMAQLGQQVSGSVIDTSLPGVPLRTIVRTAQSDSVHELTKLEKTAADASLFEVPAGYARESMGGPGAMGGPHGRR